MGSPLVSIIIPVYNAESTLRRCLDSVISQTLEDIEIIIIDDGSKDLSGQICDEYAQRDNRIKVIHKENEGVAKARQIGQEMLHGKYSIHLDADDWIEPDMYEKLFQEAEDYNADITICDILVINPGGKQELLKQELDCKNREGVMNGFLKFKVNSGLCNKLIKTDSYHIYDIKWNPELTTSEDFFILCQLFIHHPRIAYVAEPLYNYDKSANPNSISKRIPRSHIESLKFCIEYLEAHIDKVKYAEGLNERKKFLKWWMWSSHLCSQKELINTYKEVNYLFKDPKHKNRGLYSPIYYALNGHYWFGLFLQKIYDLRASSL